MSEKGVAVKMPLKLICKYCGELMYQSSIRPREFFKRNSWFNMHMELSIPDIVDRKLHFKCPSCKREITSEDLESWTIKIKSVPKT